MAYSDKPWQQIQGESMDFIHRLIKMIAIYDPEHQYPHLHSGVERFNKKFAEGDMRVHEMGWWISNLSGMLHRTMDNHDFYRAHLAENSNQPDITDGMKKYYARDDIFRQVWTFYFKDEASAKKAFDNLTEKNYILIDDIRTKCEDFHPPVTYWADGEPEPERKI